MAGGLMTSMVVAWVRKPGSPIEMFIDAAISFATAHWSVAPLEILTRFVNAGVHFALDANMFYSSRYLTCVNARAALCVSRSTS